MADHTPPAFPFVNNMSKSWEDNDNHYGFSKLEMASLMIAQGMAANGAFNLGPQKDAEVCIRCVEIAKAIIVEIHK